MRGSVYNPGVRLRPSAFVPNLVLAVSALLLIPVTGVSQSGPASTRSAADPRIDWLKQHATDIRSIQPSDTNYVDLAPLARAIGDSRIVLLGESSHGDGSTFLAKTRLIKFLHERMGFDVLVWESGLYDVQRAWQLIVQGEHARTALPKGVFGIWVNLAEVQPLLDYVEFRARTARPLEMAGADNQFSGSAAQDYFIEDLSNAFARWGIPNDRLRPGSTLRAGFDSLTARVTSTPELIFADSLSILNRELAAASRGHFTVEDGFWTRVLSGAVEVVRFRRQQADLPRTRPDTAEFIRIRNMRDVQMARNLIWLARERYPTRKIIVWAASAHLVYQYPNGLGRGYLSMGGVAREVFGKDLYQVGFTSLRGAASNPFLPGYENGPYVVPPTRSGVGIEELLSDTGKNLAFIDLRHRLAGGDWLSQPISAKVQGHTPEVGRWPDVIDGLFFIRDMQPASRASQSRPPAR